MKEPLQVTPLAAAIVEAMPDRKAVQRIQRTFNRTGEVPVSAIYPSQGAIEAFYATEVLGTDDE